MFNSFKKDFVNILAVLTLGSCITYLVLMFGYQNYMTKLFMVLLGKIAMGCGLLWIAIGSFAGFKSWKAAKAK